MNNLYCPQCNKKASRGSSLKALGAFGRFELLSEILAEYGELDEVIYCDRCKVWWIHPLTQQSIQNIKNKINSYTKI